MSQNVVTLLQQLIRIPSVNPDHPGGAEQAGEETLAVFLAGWLESIGADVRLEEIKPGRPNLIARFAPMDGRPRMLFGPHLDTVGIDGMTVDAFGGHVREGRVWGRGASDTKGPMAAMLWALHENRAILAKLPVAMDFVAFMGEESGQWGSKDFGKRYAADYNFAIVGEPTSMKVVNVTKGSLWATLRARGRACHSSMPERGENAVLKLSRALDRIDTHLGAKLADFVHPVLGPATMNVGVIRGGSRPNIVPDLAEAELDIRITPSLASAGGGLKVLESLLNDHDLDLEIIRAHENPPMETPSDHPGVKRLLAHGAVVAGAAWFSDAAHLSNAGLPSVCMGPGSIDQAHTSDEFIDVAELEKGAEFFTRFVAGLAR